MLSYPIEIKNEGDTRLTATCPDFPELSVVVRRRLEALRSAAEALDEVVAKRLARGDLIPKPSPGQPRAALSPTMEARVRNRSVGQ